MLFHDSFRTFKIGNVGPFVGIVFKIVKFLFAIRVPNISVPFGSDGVVSFAVGYEHGVPLGFGSAAELGSLLPNEWGPAICRVP